MNVKNFKYNDYINVVDYFKKNNDNRTSVIAKLLKLNSKNVSYYIDVYLSLKTNYMGGCVKMPMSLFTYKNDRYNKSLSSEHRYKLYLDGVYDGGYATLKDVGRRLNINISNHKRMEFNSSKIKKKVKIVKL